MSRVDTMAVLMEVAAERKRQTAKHGDQSHLPDGTGPFKYLLGIGPSYSAMAGQAKAHTDARSESDGDGSVTFADIALEEVFEALAESDPHALRRELVQCAAVFVQWIETLDGRGDE